MRNAGAEAEREGGRSLDKDRKLVQVPVKPMEKAMKKFWMCAVSALAIVSGGSALAGEVKITGMTGNDAYIAGKQGIQRIVQGTSCEAGDMLVTRAGTQLEIVVNGQIGCRILPGTTLAVGSTRENRTKLLVAEGNIVLNVKKLGENSEFTVDTPTAVAAVRGTQFWGRVAGGEGETISTFAVREGAVRITQKETGHLVDLSPGQAVDLGEVGAAPQARPATADEMSAMKIADEIASRM